MNSEELYAPRTLRQTVIDSVIADLDRAIEYMGSGRNLGGTRLNREVAQLFKSRVCLYEGTWEKYHNGTVFGVPSPKVNEYLTKAAEAALDLIESKIYSINTTGNPAEAYFNNFNWENYSTHPEVMLWKKYDLSLQMHHRSNANVTIFGSGGLTKELIDDYLCSDGLPKAVSPLYLGDNNISDVQTNRDPRLTQTIWGPGEPVHVYGGDTLVIWTAAPMTLSNQCNVGGYHIKKYAKIDMFDLDQEASHGYPIWRFAEALLNYAEAKAELGSLTQLDVDNTINKLRDRVGMPHLDISNIVTDPDWQFPELSPIINEIRRERRVELALEDFRWDDLARWRAHDLIVGKRYLGAKFEPARYPSIVVGKDLYLNSEGYIDPYQKSLVSGVFNFNPERDYLNPLPIDQLTLNKNLVQNPGWNP